MYLLDTNACIRLLNGTSNPLSQTERAASRSAIRLCSVVKAELLYGARHSTRVAENLRTVNEFFGPLTSLPFAEQLPGTLERHFAGDDRVVLFEVDPAAVAAGLRMEPAPRSGILFPHVYRGIARRELTRRWILERTDGRFHLPTLD